MEPEASEHIMKIICEGNTVKDKLPAYAVVKHPKMPIDQNFNPDKGVSLLKNLEESEEP